MGDNSMPEFRPRLLLCLVAIFALGALGIIAAFSVDVGQAADKAGLGLRGYVWSATRIESGIRLRGWVPTDEEMAKYRQSWNPPTHGTSLTSSADVARQGQWYMRAYVAGNDRIRLSR